MPEEKTLKIIALEAQNVKKLKAVTIKPDGNLVVIGGDNDQGKSSVLDSIMFALGGKGALPPKPVREGEKKATVTIDIGDFVVVRTLTAEGGGTLSVKTKEGAKYPSPQSLLDSLLGKLSFDPIEFSRMDPKKRLETLRSLAGVDTAPIDAKRKNLYDERTMFNRQLAAAEARLNGVKRFPEAPKEEVSISELGKQIQAAQQEEQTYQSIKEHGEKLKRALHDTQLMFDKNKSEIERLEERNKSLAEEGIQQQKELEALRKDYAAPRKYDLAKLNEQLAAAEGINEQVRANKNYDKEFAAVSDSKKQTEELTNEIEKCDKEKQALMSAAKFPLPELGFDDNGVTLNGMPWEQASASQQLRASVAMGIALNKKLRIMLIRDASLLDEKSLALIAKLADDNNTQCWVERVGKGKEVSVIIDDGMVAEKEEAK